jgi:dolichol kinase
LSIFLFVSAFILSYISFIGFKIKNNYGGASTLACSLILYFFGFYNIGNSIFPWPYNAYFTFWTIPLLLFHTLFWYVMKRREKKVGKLRIPNDDYAYPDDIPFKMELFRKFFHLAGFLLVLCFYGYGFGPLAQIINNTIIDLISTQPGLAAYENLFGSITEYYYGLNDLEAISGLTFFALWGTFAFVIFPEFIRILVGARYSLYYHLTKSVLRGKEHNSVGPQVFLILGVIVSFFLAQKELISFEISMAAILIACFSDATTALVGKRFGKHKVNAPFWSKKKSKNIKSVEGFLAGSILTYIIAMIFIGPFYALVATALFFLLDYFTLPIADNLLNPIIISLGLMVAVNVIGLPASWITAI